jgi:hypothetical protein
VLLGADADDVVERGAERALADSGDAAQFGNGHRFPQVLAEERVDASDDLVARHVMES